MLQHVKRSLGRTFVSLSYHQHFAVLVQELLVHVEQHLRRFSLTTQQGLGIIQRKITFLCIFGSIVSHTFTIVRIWLSKAGS